MHDAVFAVKPDVVKKLVAAGADLEALDQWNQTAYDIAKDRAERYSDQQVYKEIYDFLKAETEPSRPNHYESPHVPLRLLGRWQVGRNRDAFLDQFSEGKLPHADKAQLKRLVDLQVRWLQVDGLMDLSTYLTKEMKSRHGAEAAKKLEDYLDDRIEDSKPVARQLSASGSRSYEDAVNGAVVEFRDRGAKVDNRHQSGRLKYAMIYTMLTERAKGVESKKELAARHLADDIEDRMLRRLGDSKSSAQSWTAHMEGGGKALLVNLAEQAWEEARQIDQKG